MSGITGLISQKLLPFTITGMVPLPETAIDFSDLRSQSNRLNDRVSVTDLFTTVTIFKLYLYCVNITLLQMVFSTFSFLFML